MSGRHRPAEEAFMSASRKRGSPASPSSSEDGLPPCPAFTRKPGGSYPPEVREYALLLIVSGMTVKAVARRIGTWMKVAGTTE